MEIVKPVSVGFDKITTNLVDLFPAYVASTTYAKGTTVTYNRRSYLSLKDANVGHTPGLTESVEWWSDSGPSNSSAAFDGQVQTVSKRAENITATFSPVRAERVVLLNVRAKTVKCKSTFGGQVIYEETQSTWDTSGIRNWKDYFFREPEFKSEAVFTNLPAVPNQTIQVELDATGSETVEVGMILLGLPVYVGREKYGLQRSGIDYSSVLEDEFGATSITRRAYARKLTTQTFIPNTLLDPVVRALDGLSSTPVMVLSGAPCYSSTIVYGLFSYTVDLSFTDESVVSFDVKGLI